MSFVPLRRRRGGQPGNTNRLIHGRYSQSIAARSDLPPQPPRQR